MTWRATSATAGPQAVHLVPPLRVCGLHAHLQPRHQGASQILPATSPTRILQRIFAAYPPTLKCSGTDLSASACSFLTTDPCEACRGAQFQTCRCGIGFLRGNSLALLATSGRPHPGWRRRRGRTPQPPQPSTRVIQNKHSSRSRSMTHLQVECSYRRADSVRRLNVGRVLVLDIPLAWLNWRPALSSTASLFSCSTDPTRNVTAAATTSCDRGKAGGGERA